MLFVRAPHLSRWRCRGGGRARRDIACAPACQGYVTLSEKNRGSKLHTQAVCGKSTQNSPEGEKTTKVARKTAICLPLHFASEIKKGERKKWLR